MADSNDDIGDDFDDPNDHRSGAHGPMLLLVTEIAEKATAAFAEHGENAVNPYPPGFAARSFKHRIDYLTCTGRGDELCCWTHNVHRVRVKRAYTGADGKRYSVCEHCAHLAPPLHRRSDSTPSSEPGAGHTDTHLS